MRTGLGRKAADAAHDRDRVRHRSVVVEPEQSRILIYAYRDGRLARLGHNHIVSSNRFSGEVYLAQDLSSSAVELRLAVADFEIDRSDLRAMAGDEFASEIDASSIAGTRANMLSEALLDGAAWPEIVLLSRAVEGQLPALELQMDAAIKADGAVFRHGGNQ